MYMKDARGKGCRVMMKYNSPVTDGRIHVAESLEYTNKEQRRTENTQQTRKTKTGTRIFRQISLEEKQEHMEQLREARQNRTR